MAVLRLFTQFFFFSLISACLFGQGKKPEKHTYFDASWQQTEEKKALFHVRHVNISDTAWRVDTYNYFGPIIKTGTFKDEQATIPHGMLAWYNEKGVLDSTRNFFEGLPHGQWLIYDDTTLIEERTYYRGTVVKVKDAATYRSGLRSKNEPLRENEKESVFPGGEPEWMKYLKTNAKYPRKAIRREIQGSVRVKFIVGPSGYVTEAFLDRSVTMLIDDQLLELIRNSPRWEAATIDKRPVNSYKIQELTFGYFEAGRKRL
jgi:TonB family protein